MYVIFLVLSFVLENLWELWLQTYTQNVYSFQNLNGCHYSCSISNFYNLLLHLLLENSKSAGLIKFCCRETSVNWCSLHISKPSDKQLTVDSRIARCAVTTYCTCKSQELTRISNSHKTRFSFQVYDQMPEPRWVISMGRYDVVFFFTVVWMVFM